ncbi:hypothetical protein [Paracoccus mutanolyticus]|uniref:hypothetical protein n=1 Tax=Paracoccus mutanolyticus TaxID=1499308 RepID=UPI0011AE76DE|nr:hypothetical protein [Paracoccus mutanolyticus]
MTADAFPASTASSCSFREVNVPASTLEPLPCADIRHVIECWSAVISVDHNDLPHLKAWGGVSETKQRIERFKKPLS